MTPEHPSNRPLSLRRGSWPGLARRAHHSRCHHLQPCCALSNCLDRSIGERYVYRGDGFIIVQDSLRQVICWLQLPQSSPCHLTGEIQSYLHLQILSLEWCPVLFLHILLLLHIPRKGLMTHFQFLWSHSCLSSSNKIMQCGLSCGNGSTSCLAL